MLRERSQSQKIARRVISLTRDVQNRHIHRHKGDEWFCPELGFGGDAERVLRGTGVWGELVNMLKNHRIVYFGSEWKCVNSVPTQVLGKSDHEEPGIQCGVPSPFRG